MRPRAAQSAAAGAPGAGGAESLVALETGFGKKGSRAFAPGAPGTLISAPSRAAGLLSDLMHSPIHPETDLIPTELEPGLEACLCPQSGGVWIPLRAYFDWRERSASQARPLPPGYEPQAATDAGQPTLICPESSCLLVRYRVGEGLDFHIDRSPKTGGVWLDAGEWDALKSKGLHEQLHLVFTAAYQKRLRTQLIHEQLEEQFRHRIGAADFERVSEFKTWLLAHPKRRDILACLLDGEG